jgi:hypothetical protein
MAVRITTTPINPLIHRKTPEMKKTRIINITPMMKRKIPSPLPTFFTFTVGFSFQNSFPDHTATLGLKVNKEWPQFQWECTKKWT